MERLVQHCLQAMGRHELHHRRHAGTPVPVHSGAEAPKRVGKRAVALEQRGFAVHAMEAAPRRGPFTPMRVRGPGREWGGAPPRSNSAASPFTRWKPPGGALSPASTVTAGCSLATIITCPASRNPGQIPALSPFTADAARTQSIIWAIV